MAHEKVYGFCDNKCKVEVAPKTETDAVEERVTALEKGEFESVNCAGTITAESVKGLLFVHGTVVQASTGDELYGKFEGSSSTLMNHSNAGSALKITPTSDFTKSYSTPKKHAVGIYTRESDLSGDVEPAVTTRTIVVTHSKGDGYLNVVINGSTVKVYAGSGHTINATVGSTYTFYCTTDSRSYVTVTLKEIPYYVNYDTP